MTLHITLTSPSYTLQVSDRLVTTEEEIHDRYSNKNIIYWARDALVTMGYTGVAYLDGIPTDEWIVAKLCKFPLHEVPRGMIIRRSINDWLGIWHSLKLLEAELTAVMRNPRTAGRRWPFQLVVAGWRMTWHNKRQFSAVPFFAHLEKSEGDKSFTLSILKRGWHYGGQGWLDYTPSGYITSDDGRAILASIASRPSDGPWADANAVEAAFVDAIRRVAARLPPPHQKVGPHCMSILIPPPGVVPIRVRYIPDKSDTTTLHLLMGEKFPVVFSPWIIGPDTAHTPLEMSGGGWMLEGTPFSVQLECPDKAEKVSDLKARSQHRTPLR